MTRSLTALALLLSTVPALAGPDAMTREEARHVISRTGFGAAPHEIAAFTGLSYEDAVQRILSEIATEPSTPMPAFTQHWPYPQDQIWALGQTAEEAFSVLRWNDLASLQQWWLAEMIATPTPLTERLTLFWHDHFATSFDELENPHWMADQNVLFRRHAASNFAELAEGILHDPAMLAYLTNTENLAEAPNENLAREFMELFTLGEGRGYTEEDVKEAARALTGHGVAELSVPVFHFYEEHHDRRRKTILGVRGSHDAVDFADIVLNDPAFGPYIVEKLWREFISDVPDPEDVARLTELWKANDLNMRPLLEALFLTDAFWDPANRGRLVKSPVELLVGTVRSLGIEVPNLAVANWGLGELGQELFFPPNVGGWPEGTGWINDATATGRAWALTYLTGWDLDEEMDGPKSPMMMLQPAAAPEGAGDLSPGDLRVGHVFAVEAEAEEETTGALITLYDVGWNGQDWRSLNVWIEHSEDEPPSINIHTGDCAPDCFPNYPFAEDGWIHFATWDDFGEELEDVRTTDRELLRVVIDHMPALIEETAEHVPWDNRLRAEEDLPRIDMGDVVRVAKDLRAQSRPILGQPAGNLIRAATPRGNIGLAPGLDYGQSMDAADVQDAFEELEESNVRAGRPAVVYSSAEAWFAALEGAGPDSAIAETALLAVPLPTEGRRMSLTEDDPDAMVRAYVLHPHFQVN